MGLLKKAASGVLAIFPCSRSPSTLCAQSKGDALRDVAGNTWPSLREASGQDWTDFFEQTRRGESPKASWRNMAFAIFIVQHFPYVLNRSC